MKKILFTTLLVLVMVFPAVAQGWMLQWNANPEGDMLGYRVFSCTSTDSGSCTRVDDPANDITTSEVCHPLDPYVDDGLYYRVTAVDTSLNESDFSDVVYFDPWTGLPSIPTGIQILDQTCPSS